ncbi:sex comb on midleg-like protein 2 isoform 3-T3 [Thomomys bottae]
MEETPEKDTMGQTANEESMDVKKDDDEKPSDSGTSSVQSDYFNWDEYLKETGSISAPSECFRQSEIPPTNDFKIGMKLEARDPRNMSSVCVATVIGCTGARLHLRLDGSDDKNDFWRLVDSSDIQPVGTCEKKGQFLQPPLGYQMSVSSWPMFLLKTLNEAEMASPTLFKMEPPKPPLNNFKVGMKLEAVDRKNPYFICPATIGDIKGEKVYVQFDGWSGTFDYWCKYDSRDLFPVGWCCLTGDVLQPLGKKAKKKNPKSRGVTRPLKDEEEAIVPDTKAIVEAQSSASEETHQSGQSSQKTVVSAPTQATRKSSRIKKPKPTPVPKKGSSVKTTTSKKTKEKFIPVLCSTSSASLRSLTRGRGSSKDAIPGPSKIVMSTVCVYVNKHGNTGPHLDPKKIQNLPDHFGPGPVNVILRRIVQSLVDCAFVAKTVFGFLKPDNRGGEVITATFDGENHAIQLPPVNSASFALRFLETLCHSLECDNLLSSQPFSSFKGTIHNPTEQDKPVSKEPSETQSMKRSQEPVCFDSVPLKMPKLMIHPSKEKLLLEGCDVSLEENIPEDSDNPPLSLEDCLSSVCEVAPTTSSVPPEEKKSPTKGSYFDSSFQMHGENEDPSFIAVPDPSVLKQGFSKDPSTWSVDEVIRFMKHTDPQISGPLADLFRQHEIDGDALLLLKSDMMMKYMGLKLGPALKLCYYIEKLKEGKYN